MTSRRSHFFFFFRILTVWRCFSLMGRIRIPRVPIVHGLAQASGFANDLATGSSFFCSGAGYLGMSVMVPIDYRRRLVIVNSFVAERFPALA